MKIQDITNFLESIAPIGLQENYDNAGLLTGSAKWDCTGMLTTLDATEAVVLEAIKNQCNLIVAHHPIIFGGLQKISGSNYVEKAVITAIKNDIAIYAIHTNLDNVMEGVNGKIANQLGLQNCEILLPKQNSLKKLETYSPIAHAQKVRDAIFEAGGGQVGNYSDCSFQSICLLFHFRLKDGKKSLYVEQNDNNSLNEEKVRYILEKLITLNL